MTQSSLPTVISHRAADVPIFWKWAAAGLLRLWGWRVVGELPDIPKLLFIGAPHTSNFDGILTVAAACYMRGRVRWMGKVELLRTPLAPIFRLAGILPVDRRAPQGFVEQVAAMYAAHERLMVAVTPEGTRKKTDGWKSGFYRIALAAKVPIICVGFDYQNKLVHVGLVLYPNGDIEADMQKIATFYQGIVGRFPDRTAPVRLRSGEMLETTASRTDSDS